ncbi:hypothetical protein KP509_12G047000 [Ceratopteris richardii]|uniref:Protein kinase domain-containing protein n=1 Tax=Ceratopteris richardii TaxID=49495 RepID=A0A8T2TN81_CERRI|nr:hypothetical protein KP509_12G047000 [Ceratopteris richardii]KAH7423263.1 hypothetical protein KP509_12G047000 [Ceratopteris richardii]KAH7423264.1 hypothetical protein KP509_12G047000 [Ceratopteris richardii]
MEKRAVWNTKINSTAKIISGNECATAEINCTKIASNEAPMYQQQDHISSGSSYTQGMLEGMVVHYIHSDQPSNLTLKSQALNNCNIQSCKRDLSERNLDSKTSISQVESYRQECREHQIQQWISKHSYTQDTLPKDHWLEFYPQPNEAGNASRTLTSLQNLGAYKDLGTSQVSRQPHTFFRNPTGFDDLEPGKKLAPFFSSKALITESSSLQASEGVSLKKRKMTDSKTEIDQEVLLNLLTAQQHSDMMPSSSDNGNETGVTLRQWLSRPSRTVDSLESLNIFRQILQVVDLAHAQGVVLKNIRPSLFLLSSLHRVTFLDSMSSSSSSRSSDPSTGGASVQASLLADTATTRVGTSHSTERRSLAERESSWKAISSAAPFLQVQTGSSAERLQFGFGSQPWETGQTQSHDNSRDSGGSQSSSKLQQKNMFPVRSTRIMEDMWYTSPEEAQDGTCSFASDIYSLGVLFFELFCPFGSWDEHVKVMQDLRHRILPSNLLSDRPKEAAFCLWLLHPEPNSRPKSRDVVQSEILNDAGEALAERQDAMNIEEKELETELLLDFLLLMEEQKRNLASKLREEISCLTSDIIEVKRRRSCIQHPSATPEDPDPSSRITHEGSSRGAQCNLAPSVKQLHEDAELFSQGQGTEIAVESIEKQSQWGFEMKRKDEQIRSKSARLMSNFDKFEEAYFAMRRNVEAGMVTSQATQLVGSERASAVLASDFLDVSKSSRVHSSNTEEKDTLGCFFDSLCKYARYSKFEVKATLLHGNLSNTSNMVCSLGFDRDQEYFATAGICRRIRVFDYDAVLSENVDIHYPVVEMMTNSKLSSICWNTYIKSHIASSDYDGVVQLWDASVAQTLMQYKEHRKRAWSVDFSQADPTKLASGSDDGTVKLWSINQEGSIGTIKTEANVCCVQFPGGFAHLIAFGSVDYKVYCYDLRNTRVPWCILANHTKAVSYVKFLDSDTIVSASTDNTLKLWKLSRTNMAGGVCKSPSLTFTGHTNEKNFVGLSVMDGYIACGSETNAVFAYHRSLPMPVATHKFGWVDPLTGKNMGDDTGKFVSSVCWRAKSQTLVAANSLGNVKVLEMV